MTNVQITTFVLRGNFCENHFFAVLSELANPNTSTLAACSNSNSSSSSNIPQETVSCSESLPGVESRFQNLLAVLFERPFNPVYPNNFEHKKWPKLAQNFLLCRPILHVNSNHWKSFFFEKKKIDEKKVYTRGHTYTQEFCGKNGVCGMNEFALGKPNSPKIHQDFSKWQCRSSWPKNSFIKLICGQNVDQSKVLCGYGLSDLHGLHGLVKSLRRLCTILGERSSATNDD